MSFVKSCEIESKTFQKLVTVLVITINEAKVWLLVQWLLLSIQKRGRGQTEVDLLAAPPVDFGLRKHEVEWTEKAKLKFKNQTYRIAGIKWSTQSYILTYSRL